MDRCIATFCVSGGSESWLINILTYETKTLAFCLRHIMKNREAMSEGYIEILREIKLRTVKSDVRELLSWAPVKALTCEPAVPQQRRQLVFLTFFF